MRPVPLYGTVTDPSGRHGPAGAGVLGAVALAALTPTHPGPGIGGAESVSFRSHPPGPAPVERDRALLLGVTADAAPPAHPGRVRGRLARWVTRRGGPR